MGIGGASDAVGGTRVGAIVGQVDVAVFPIAHLGLVLGARAIVIPSYRHDLLFAAPILIGPRAR